MLGAAEALEIARRAGDRLGLANVLFARAYAINDPTTLVERLTLVDPLTQTFNRRYMFD